jgi:hypothetical protein
MTATDYDVTFKVVMPGQARATDYKIAVKAESRVEALAIAEAEWEKQVMAYDNSIKQVSKVIEA